MRHAFVFHSTRDDSYVAEMTSFLRKAGFDEVFNDASSIQPDEQLWPVIERGIIGCDAFVVVITAASNGSAWVKREVELARSLSKQIIPVWIEDCPLPPWFADRDVIDFRPRTRQERRFEISRIFKYAPAELIGRADETKLLNDAWQKTLRLERGRPRVLTFVALGGEGKTALVAKWAAELAAQDWPGCDAAFAWSFYSQGTREQQASSSDLFLKEGLNFFAEGHADEKEIKAFAASPAGAFEKGQRLARLVGQRRSLLILDGLEPLQYAPTAPTPGELKDQGLVALLKGLAAASHGLCVVTTRYSLPDLRAFWQTTAPEVKLLHLSREAGVHLLKTLGVTGTAQEFAALVEDVKGHALTLTLLGGFLKRAFHGDIRQRDRVKFEKADEKMDGGHAFRTMAAYEQWLLRDGGDEGRREVAVLRLMGLFDRPADAGCLAALRHETIPGLTEPLAGLADDDWEYCLTGLEAAKLLTVNRDASGALVSLDAHPHIREYFAAQLKWGAHAPSRAVSGALAGNAGAGAVTLPGQPTGARVGTREGACAPQTSDAWRAAHRRLYEHLCASTPDKPQPTLEDLQPLYQAVAHGCQAGLQQEVCDSIYRGRILRGLEAYAVHKLGAYVSGLGAIACFFEQPWNRISSALTEPAQSWLMGEAAFHLHNLGRLTEALEPMRASVAMDVKAERWEGVANTYKNLSELELAVGAVAEAVADAERSVTYADRSGEWFARIFNRCAVASALHQAGRLGAAQARFREAEQMQMLYSLRGFQYCDLLLAAPERAAWQTLLECGGKRQRDAALASTADDATTSKAPSPLRSAGAVQNCRAVSRRAAQTLKIAEHHLGLLDVALDHLTLGCAALYEAILDSRSRRRESAQASSAPEFDQRGLTSAATALDAAVPGLRRAGTQDHLPRALLTRAWLRCLTGAYTGPESAQEDLDEAWEIAERGPMRLFMADIHLHRARLFFREKAYPWESPGVDLAAARRLIEQCGYWRRKEELEDAEMAIGV
jgi:hypothetical protein